MTGPQPRERGRLLLPALGAALARVRAADAEPPRQADAAARDPPPRNAPPAVVRLADGERRPTRDLARRGAALPRHRRPDQLPARRLGAARRALPARAAATRPGRL